MSDAQQPFGFAPFMPGMDFLQQLTKAGQSAAQGLWAHWLSPSLSVEDIDKRIEELQAVQFWLEQNSRALTATVQALQVQKMTLSTLQSMNVNLGEFSKAFPWTAGMGASAAPAQKTDAAAQAERPTATASAAPQPSTSAPAQEAAADTHAAAAAAAAPAAAAAAPALQWWSALTQQFQQIAAQSLQDPAPQAALQQASSMATPWAQAAAKTASDFLQVGVPAAAATDRASESAAAARQAASAGKPAGKSAPQAEAKDGSVPPVGAATTAARQPTSGPSRGGDTGADPAAARPRRTAAPRKRSA